MRIILFLDTSQHLLKIRKWHIRMKRRHPAIAAAMTAFHIASESALPKQLPQLMFFSTVEFQLAVQLKCNSLFNGQYRHITINYKLSQFLKCASTKIHSYANSLFLSGHCDICFRLVCSFIPGTVSLLHLNQLNRLFNRLIFTTVIKTVNIFEFHKYFVPRENKF